MTPCKTDNCETHASLLKDNEAYCSNCYIELFEPILFRILKMKKKKKRFACSEKNKRVVGITKNIIQISNYQQK